MVDMTVSFGQLFATSLHEVDGFNIILTNGETLYLSRLEKKSFLEKFTRFVVGD